LVSFSDGEIGQVYQEEVKDKDQTAKNDVENVSAVQGEPMES